MHGSGAVSCSCSLLIRGPILPAVRQKLHLSPCADSRSRLSGSIKTLSRDKPIIVFEHGLGAADYYNTRPEQVFELLSSCGLCISSLSGFLRRRRSFTKKEFTKIFYNHIDYYFVAHP